MCEWDRIELDFGEGRGCFIPDVPTGDVTGIEKDPADKNPEGGDRKGGNPGRLFRYPIAAGLYKTDVTPEDSMHMLEAAEETENGRHGFGRYRFGRYRFYCGPGFSNGCRVLSADFYRGKELLCRQEVLFRLVIDPKQIPKQINKKSRRISVLHDGIEITAGFMEIIDGSMDFDQWQWWAELCI